MALALSRINALLPADGSNAVVADLPLLRQSCFALRQELINLLATLSNEVQTFGHRFVPHEHSDVLRSYADVHGWDTSQRMVERYLDAVESMLGPAFLEKV